MKIKENYLQEALKAEKKDKPNWASEARRQIPVEHSDAANKLRQTDSPLKDEMKFANLLESSGKPQKANQQREESGEQRRDDQKKDKKLAAREKDSAENLTGDGKAEKNESFGGQAGGGQSGFGAGGGVNQLSLNDNFAARSILHIADLERLISTVRTQIGLGGRREIVLQLKRSVLEGLQVKITTDANSKVALEFLAANENVRSQIESHSQELGEILRGRGINLETLKTTVNSDGRGGSPGDENPGALETSAIFNSHNDDFISDNTFERVPETDDTIYKA